MPQIDLNTLLELVGQLDDSSDPGNASDRFRKYLQGNIRQVDEVRSYVNDALTQSGDQFNKALQDLINHIGQLLEFDVTYGRYRGVRGEIGFDGLWRSPMGWAIVVEAKTTDVYTVKTAPLLGYINSLVSAGHIPNASNVLGLYVYGRFDTRTNQLENAITVEGRRERLRVVSVEALLHLLELKQEYNLTHETILDVLLPAPVRVDDLVNLIFNIVAQEKEEEMGEVLESVVEKDEEEEVVVEEEKEEKLSSNLVSISENYTGRTPQAVTLLGHRYEVQTWKEIALRVCDVLNKHDPHKFATEAVTVRGRKRPYVSTDKNALRSPHIIPGTSLHFEANLGANSIVKLCCTLMEKMGYKKSDLLVESQE